MPSPITGSGDYYALIQEAHQKATKDSVCFLSGGPPEDCSYWGIDGQPVPAAGTGVWPAYNNLGATEHLVAQAKFTYGSGGTTAKFYIQSSFDKERTWFDIMCFAFAKTTARKIGLSTLGVEEANPENIEDAELADNTSRNGVLGDVFRVKYVIVGTYVDSRICIAGIAKSF